MNTPADLLFILLPLAVFFIHAMWGSKMWIFGYDDGITCGIVGVGIIYLIGLTLIQNEFRMIGYTLMVISFSVRPALHHLFQYLAHRYHKKNKKPVPFPEFE